MERTEQLAPLGFQRIRLLECLGGHDPRLPGYFDPEPDIDIFAALRSHVAWLSQEWSAETDSTTVRLLAAARLLTGDVTAAQTIIDQLPANAFELDHGAGICLVVPFHALKTALPLPSELGDVRRWTAGSPEQTALQEWLTAHRDRLRWVETKGTYDLA
jgi:hypothetical protein